MIQKFQIKTSGNFERELERYHKLNKKIGKKILDTLVQLSNNPFYRGLYTHKVNSHCYGKAYSSRVTGDIRILWDFQNGITVILILSVGGHSGGKAIY